MESTAVIRVVGMTCGGCAASVTRALERLAGVSHVDVSLDQATATVAYDPGRLALNDIRAAIEVAGFDTPTA